MKYTVNGVTFEFNPSNLHLRAMQAGGQSWLANATAGHPIWMLYLADSRGQKVEIDGEATIFDALYDQNKKRYPLEYGGKKPWAAMEDDALVLRWEEMHDPLTGVGPVTVRVDIRPADAPHLTAWRMNVDNASEDWTLWHFLFPVLIVAGDDTAATDRFFWPALWGRQQTGWQAMPNIGQAPMSFFGMTRGASSLYFASHDGRKRGRELRFEKTKTPDAGYQGNLHFRTYPEGMSEPGNGAHFDCDYVVGAVEGDWYDAARTYARWARRQSWTLPPGDMERGSREARQVHIWAQASINHQPCDRLLFVNNGKTPAQWVEEMLALRRRFGVRMGIHLYHWYPLTFETVYGSERNYFPARPGVAEMMRQLRDADIAVMPYINGLIWNINNESFDAEAERHAAKWCADRTRGRKRWVNLWYGDDAVMCMHTAFWRDTLVKLCRHAIEDMGAEAVYLDQVAATPLVLCMDPAHGHPVGGGDYWYRSVRALAAELRRAIGPKVLLTSEMNWEGCAGAFDGLLDTCLTTDNLPLFPAVYWGQAMVFGGGDCGGDMDKCAQLMGTRWVWGGQMGWDRLYYLLDEKNGPYLQLVAQMCQLRERHCRTLVSGEFLRPPILRVDARRPAACHPVTGPVLGSMWGDPDNPAQARLFLVNVTRDVAQTDVVITDEHWGRARPAPEERDLTPLAARKRRTGFTVKLPALTARVVMVQLDK